MNRYVLNFKKLPYQTVWVEYPQIKPEITKIGAGPSFSFPDGSGRYTVSTIHDPNTGAVVTDSIHIAEYLEKTYPDSPKLFPAGSEGLQAAFYATIEEKFLSTIPRLLMALAHESLHPVSQEYFRRIMETAFGKKLESLSDDSEEQWKKFRAFWKQVAAWYGKNGSGPFIQGDQLTYGDIAIGSYFVWYGNLVEGDSDQWRDMLTWDEGRWSKLADALKPFEAVD